MIHYRHLIYELRRQIYTLNQEGYSQNDMARFFRTRKGSKSSRGQIKNSVSIHDCPTVVDRNERIGDWEIDLMIGKDHSSVMVTMVKCFKFYRCRADGRPVGHNYHIVRAPAGPVLPITADNGKAFSGHESVAKVLSAEVYCADPYSSWQRGLNENANDLLRQYWSKKTDLKGRIIDQKKRLDHKKLADVMQ